MALGLTNKGIAKRLELGARTVESHVAHVLGKLEATTRTGAVAEARQRGLLPTDFSIGGIRSFDLPRHNLPVYSTPLLGREADVAYVTRLLETDRLVTLTGAGGVGKTRLAVRVGAGHVGRWPNGVWFCDFSALSDSTSVERAVAWTIGVRERPGRILRDSIVSALTPKRTLLIFDNCEHVADAAKELAQTILAGCSDVAILATSRQRLAVPGEVVHRVPSLAVPESLATLTADTAMASSAVALFVERARAGHKEFVLTDRDAPFLGALCQHLDGIPLAIELAAARVSSLSVETLSANLDRVFLNLKGLNEAAPRHATMRALLDWSYELLPADERTLLRRLAVFAGGFTLDLASSVCREAIPRAHVLDVLGSLIEKSLVQRLPNAMAERYGLLESTRRYALERQIAAGESGTICCAHAQAMADVAHRLDSAQLDTPDSLWFAQARPELPNWRAALQWAFAEGGDAHLGAAIAGSIDVLWRSYYLEVEGLAWIEAAFAALDAQAPVALQARLELARAKIYVVQKKSEGLTAAERARSLYEQLGDPLGVAAARATYGAGLVIFGRFAEVQAHLQEVLTVAEARGWHRLVGVAKQGIAGARFYLGDAAGARIDLLDALVEFELAGDDRGMAQVATNLALIAWNMNEREEAVRLCQRALAAESAVEYHGAVPAILQNMTEYLIVLGRFEEALRYAREALALARQTQHEFQCALAVQSIAAIAALRPCTKPAAAREDRFRAACLLGFADARFAESEYLRDFAGREAYDNMVLALRAELDENQFRELHTTGAGWLEDRAVAEALEV
jgi:predicted ATPase